MTAHNHIPRRPLASLRAFLGSIACRMTTSVTPELELHKLQGALTESDEDVQTVVNAVIDVLEEWAASGVPGSGGSSGTPVFGGLKRELNAWHATRDGDWQTALFWDGSNAVPNGVTVNADNGTIYCLTTGNYRVTCVGIVTKENSDTDALAVRVVRNDVQLDGYLCVGQSATATENLVFAFDDIVSLTAGDILKLQVYGPANADSMDIPGAHFSIEKKAGVMGSAAFTTSTGSFTMPASSATASVEVDDSQAFPIGCLVYMEGAGYLRVDAIADSTHLTLENEGASGNASPATVIAAGAKIAISGEQGAATGSAGGHLMGTYPNPSLNSASSPTLTGLTLSGLTASRYVTTNGSKALTSQQGVPHTDITVASAAAGDVFYHNGTTLVRLPKGTNGDVLTSGTAPAWTSSPTFTTVTMGVTDAGFQTKTEKATGTSNATPTNVLTVTIPDSTGGLLTALVTAHKSDGSITFSQVVKVPYKKVAGTLTLGTVVQATGDSVGTTTGAGASLVSSSNNIAVEATGLAATTLRWGVRWELDYRTTAA